MDVQEFQDIMTQIEWAMANVEWDLSHWQVELEAAQRASILDATIDNEMAYLDDMLTARHALKSWEIDLLYGKEISRDFESASVWAVVKPLEPVLPKAKYEEIRAVNLQLFDDEIRLPRPAISTREVSVCFYCNGTNGHHYSECTLHR